MRAFRILGLLSLFVAGAALAHSPAPAHGPAQPPAAEVAALMTKALSDYPGKEALMISVTYPPGAVDPVHRHDAHAFLYVLEGSIVMGLKGGKEVTLTPGQTFYEGPNDIHTIGRNASLTKPAKFLVVLLKNQDEDVVLPVD
ncbi:Cupin [Rhodanobacter sp. Root179]|jgi:quercetin dioxygenase-like cupin family protein|nr:cupin [Rhodanobacter sp. Root561]KRB34058.1 cupin [Rhodanobacter sp. Root179]